MSYISDHINQSSDIMPGIALEAADEIERLEKEAARWKADYLEQVDKRNLTLDELAESQMNDLYAMKLLAESQAREAKLREYLYSIESSDIGPGQMSVIAKDALALPTDDTALMEALKAERESLLELCKCHEYCSDLADTIRAMED